MDQECFPMEQELCLSGSSSPLSVEGKGYANVRIPLTLPHWWRSSSSTTATPGRSGPTPVQPTSGVAGNAFAPISIQCSTDNAGCPMAGDVIHPDMIPPPAYVTPPPSYQVNLPGTLPAAASMPPHSYPSGVDAPAHFVPGPYLATPSAPNMPRENIWTNSVSQPRSSSSSSTSWKQMTFMSGCSTTHLSLHEQPSLDMGNLCSNLQTGIIPNNPPLITGTSFLVVNPRHFTEDNSGRRSPDISVEMCPEFPAPCSHSCPAVCTKNVHRIRFTRYCSS